MFNQKLNQQSSIYTLWLHVHARQIGYHTRVIKVSSASVYKSVYNDYLLGDGNDADETNATTTQSVAR
jgi:hypothetical protein